MNNTCKITVLTTLYIRSKVTTVVTLAWRSSRNPLVVTGIIYVDYTTVSHSTVVPCYIFVRMLPRSVFCIGCRVSSSSRQTVHGERVETQTEYTQQNHAIQNQNERTDSIWQRVRSIQTTLNRITQHKATQTQGNTCTFMLPPPR